MSHWDPSKLTHISTGILTTIARAVHIKIPVKMCQFTRIPMNPLNVSFMLQNFSHWEEKKIFKNPLVNVGKIPFKMWQYTRIPMTRLNVSFMLQNFSQRAPFHPVTENIMLYK